MKCASFVPFLMHLLRALIASFSRNAVGKRTRLVKNAGRKSCGPTRNAVVKVRYVS